MSEPKCISPLLDGFSLGASLSEHHGVKCYPAIREDSEEKYIVKVISVPASQVQMDALLLAGAFKEPEDAMKYFRTQCDNIHNEAAFLKELSKLDGFLSYDGWQTEPITRHRLGYEVYLVGTYKKTLAKFVRNHPITHLEAMNMALDLCNALTVSRQAGSLYVDLKPENVFLSEKKQFLIGDLGFISLDSLKYAALPEKYISSYTPPELHDPLESVNMSVDTYALGMILYQLYNEGNLPDLTAAEETGITAPVNADYELAEIILKSIDPNPELRWQEPEKMAQSLVAYMQRNFINDVPITPYTPIDPESQNVKIPQDSDAFPEQDPIVSAVDIALAPNDIRPEQSSLAEENILEDTPSEPQVSQDIETTDTPNESEEPNQPPVTDIIQTEVSVAPDEAGTVGTPVPAVSGDLSIIFAKADDLISHETPGGVVLPEIPEQEDPFAFATEDSIETADLHTPFDPVMNVDPTKEDKNRPAGKFRSDARKKKVKRFFGSVLLLLFLAGICFGGFWFYRNIYMQSIDRIDIVGSRDSITVSIQSEARENLLLVTCSDTYGNSQSSSVKNGKAEFSGLIPNTMYTISVEIDGFHALMGQTSDIFTTETTTNITSFSVVAGSSDGTAVINFSVDGEEPEKWKMECSADGEKTQTVTFYGHNATVENLTLGKLYTFSLNAGSDYSLSGKTSVTFIPSRLILAENLVATTKTGTDMTIRWNSPGDTVVEFWNVRCYNDSGYEKTVSVTETEVYLTEIDPSMSYIVEVTAAGMTQPARTSITANPINITGLQAEESGTNKLTVQWTFTGAEPEGGWLFMYRIDGNANMNVVKCTNPSAEISPRIPEANYQFTIQAADGTSIFDNVHDYTCPEANPYNANAITASQITAHLLKTPEDPTWCFERVGKDAFTDVFELGDAMSMVLHSNNDFYLPGTDIKVLYVIRDAHGNVIPNYVTEADENWRSIWYTGNYHYGELDIPVIPEVAGKYHVSVYIDGAFITELSFTVQ